MLCFTACGGLPKSSPRSPSATIKDTDKTRLAASVRPKLATRPGQSGLHALSDAHEALVARLALADAAQRSLDVQYFIWNKDLVGRILLERIFQAADRGVRVRLLLDDLGTMPGDRELLTISSHPNIEVRMFNPAGLRSVRLLGIVSDLIRVNKRMHNKSFIADNQVAILGGRNIGDEYFGADAGANFADLDVAVIGPVVNEASTAFDLYWNHPAALPIEDLAPQKITPAKLAEQRAKLSAYQISALQTDYAKALRKSEFAHQLKNDSVYFHWGQATIVHDHPDKVLTPAHDSKTHLAPLLRELAEQTKSELFLVSPYFVPGKGGAELLAKTSRRGVRVVILTNSLASTDGVPVHSAYQRYRQALVEAGVELYEMKQAAAPHGKRKSGGGLFGSRGAGASSGASLHAKTFAFDRLKGFIGSYNLDPRSSRLNTEMGVLFDCPSLARLLPETVEHELRRNTYRVLVERNRLVWVTEENGREIRFTQEPHSTFTKRLKSSVLSILPIEGLL